MHERIAAFPSATFYDGQLITATSCNNPASTPWKKHPCFPTLAFWNIPGKMTISSRGGIANNDEATFITNNLLVNFSAILLRAQGKLSVGIITFYKDQVEVLQKAIADNSSVKRSKLSIRVATVDGFQGLECDIIILSCVRSEGSKAGKKGNTVGFLSDYKRMNVSLTRAKKALWIVGNAAILRKSKLWRELIDNIENNGDLKNHFDFRGMISTWQAKRA